MTEMAWATHFSSIYQHISCIYSKKTYYIRMRVGRYGKGTVNMENIIECCVYIVLQNADIIFLYKKKECENKHCSPSSFGHVSIVLYGYGAFYLPTTNATSHSQIRYEAVICRAAAAA